jgi:hypothetical protein
MQRLHFKGLFCRLAAGGTFARGVARGVTLCSAAICGWALAAHPATAATPQPPPLVSVQIYSETIVRVPAAPAAVAPAPLRPAPPKAGRKRCIDVSHVAGAIVYGDKAVELMLSTGQRWRMYLAQGCPTLSFYQGFYYRRAQAGRLCAGRDAVIVRSGGECAIVSIMPVPRQSGNAAGKPR